MAFSCHIHLPVVFFWGGGPLLLSRGKDTIFCCGSRGSRINSMLNSSENEIYHAHNC